MLYATRGMCPISCLDYPCHLKADYLTTFVRLQKVYAVMVYLHDSYDMHTIFKPGFPGMMECFHAQEKLVKLLMPEVAEVFVRLFLRIHSGCCWDCMLTLFPCRTRTIYPFLRSGQSGISPFLSTYFLSAPNSESGISSSMAVRMCLS